MSEPSAAALAAFEEREADTTDYGLAGNPRVRYRLMPPVADAPGSRYPLIVYLHGAGERGDDNRRQLRYLPEVLAEPENRRRYPCFVLALQCPAGRQWIDVPWSEVASRSIETTSQPMRMLRKVGTDVVTSEHVDLQRIYLTGISMGGFGCWYLAQFEPDVFAAVAPICGGGDESQAEELKDVPIWAVHGERDVAVPVERSRNMIAAIRAAGGSPKYSELQGVGHNCWSQAYDPAFGLLDWMFEQRQA